MTERFEHPDALRRDFLRAAAAVAGSGWIGASLPEHLAAAEEAHSPATAPSISPDASTGDILVETLVAWNVPFVFGMVGDGINPIVEALRKRQDRIRYIGVRHEEAAAFMAAGYAKYTGQLGVCLATTGPGAVHLMNGLYDAYFDGAPVLAITGTTFHDLIGTRYQQGIDTVALMNDIALYNTLVTGPAHALMVCNIACRSALGNRGVAHLTIPKDVQAQRLSQDKPSKENHGARTSSAWMPPRDAPGTAQLRAAAEILNAGRRVAILAGQGAMHARDALERAAEAMAAPIAKSLLAKCLLPDDSALTTGGIGHLGTLPSSQMMAECDTLLILGSTMPWTDYYPKPGQARAVQIDRNPERLGLRYPVEVGLVGDVDATLSALLPLLKRKSDRSFLTQTQARMRDWNAMLDRIEHDGRQPMRPQVVVRALSDLLDENAIISLDCGANTHFAARHLRAKSEQKLTVSGMLASMAPGLPFAIAAKLAYPDRQSVALVGDGGFAMLMAELTTAVRLNLPVKVILLKNNTLSEVQFEQEELGNPAFGCELGPIDFVTFAQACGAEGYRCTRPEEVRATLRAALASPQAALVEAVVDPSEHPMRPEKMRM
jgi:pyruvate dehydrogenase (quinone)